MLFLNTVGQSKENLLVNAKFLESLIKYLTEYDGD